MVRLNQQAESTLAYYESIGQHEQALILAIRYYCE